MGKKHLPGCGHCVWARKKGRVKRGVPHTTESRSKIKLALIGHVHSDETKAKLRTAAVARWQHDTDIKAKVIASNKRRRGIKFSEERKAKISEGIKRHMDTAVGCRCGVCQRPLLGETLPERQLKALLQAAFPEVEEQKRFGRFRVDFYVAGYHLAYEADGSYWHDAAADAKRDAWLMANFGLPVVRFTDVELVRLTG